MSQGKFTVWLNYTQDQLDNQYNQRVLVPNANDYMTRHALLSHDVRKRLKCQLNVPYGPAPDQVLDIFPAAIPAAPVVIYFHGGAWTRWHKDYNSYQAPAFVDRNITFISVNFSLVPKVSLDGLIYECRTSIKWIWHNAKSIDADPKKLFIAGHSSGAHIVGLLAVTNWEREWGMPSNVIKGGIAASGMYDLEPVRLSSRNEYLNLDIKAVERNSAIRQIPNQIPPMIIAYGAIEQCEFRRQSMEFATKLQQLKHLCTEMSLPDLNHFEVGEQFSKPESTLMRKTYSLIEA